VSEAVIAPDSTEPVSTIHEIPENMDRSTYRSLQSPEAFVLEQEHFQKQFFEEMVDLDYPGLEIARAAHAQGKIALASYELAEYFRRKTEPAAFMVAPDPNPEQTTNPEADDIVRHVFHHHGDTVDMGPHISWSRHILPDSEWLWSFNSHSHFRKLLRAYLATGNEKYAVSFADQMSDWVVQNPAPPYTLTRVAAWRNLEAGARAAQTWPEAFYGFLNSASFRPQHIQLMLGSLWSHGEYIFEHPAGLRKPSNWSVVDSTGLVGVGVYFPEFRESARWRETGYERLSQQLRYQVYPDGAQYELTPMYHIKCLRGFDHAWKLAKEYDLGLPEGFSARFESMYEYLMWIAKPNGRAPAVSDAGQTNLKPLLVQGADRFDRDDMRYFGTGGAAGSAPARSSVFLPHAGYAVMRSGWDTDARYLFFDGGPLGIAHGHEDKLSIVLSAFGRDFIVDRSVHAYTPDQWRHYLVGTAAHSTVLVDRHGQNRSNARKDLEAWDGAGGFWHSDATLDYVRNTYTAGYGAKLIPVRHTRHVIFRKPRYWVIIDVLEGDGEHSIETLFQFKPGLKIGMGAGGVATTQEEDGPNLRIVPAASGAAEALIVEGQTEPVLQGWQGLPGTGKVAPAPTLQYARTGPLPLLGAYALIPSEGRTPRSVPQVSIGMKSGRIVVRVGPVNGNEDTFHVHEGDVKPVLTMRSREIGSE
jgi:heparinase II/III-like protein